MHARQHYGEDECVNEEKKERIDERPEEAEDGAAVPRLQLSSDETLDQRAITEKLLEAMEQAFPLYPRSRA